MFNFEELFMALGKRKGGSQGNLFISSDELCSSLSDRLMCSVAAHCSCGG